MKAIFRSLSYLALIAICGQAMGNTIEDRLTELEEQMQEVGVTNPQGTFGAGFAPAGPDVPNHWYGTVEPLYWHAKVGGTEYAYTNNDVPEFGDVFLPQVKGRVKHQDFNWDWGIRIGLGRYFDHDNWDLYLNYTWFEDHDSEGTIKHTPAAVLSLKGLDAAPFREAKSTFDINYNNINLELGRHYFMSAKSSVRLQIGLKTAWIEEKQKVRYNLPFFPQLLGPGTDVKHRDKTLLWGIGPRTGVEVEGYIGDGFSLYGKLTGSLLYGYSRTSYHHDAEDTSTGLGEAYEVQLRGKTHLFVPTAQMMLGVIWETYMNKRRQHLTLGAGYEVEYYWRANQIFLTNDNSSFFRQRFPSRRIALQRVSEDVMFYGLTLKARLDF